MEIHWHREGLSVQRYSSIRLLREALRGHSGWEQAWNTPDLRPQYDYIIIGAGGHGLATAYYLGKNHAISNVAILEKGWLGGGNTGRNTTIIRSNYLHDESVAIYEKSRQLYESMSEDLNMNVMFSPRGVLTLAQTHHEVHCLMRIAGSNFRQGIDTEFITPSRISEICPSICIDGPRYPVRGALWHPQGGTARHDAVAWGYARACSAMGMHVIEDCEVTGILQSESRVTGVTTTRGAIHCNKLGIVAAGYTGKLAEMAGFELPIESVSLQALVSEPVKPFLDVVVMANTVHGYVSQSDKGELVIGGGTDGYNNFSQRGSFTHIEESISALVEMFPMISRLRILRQWGGIVDMTADRSPIISKTPVKNLYVDCGWGTGGFKAIPGSGWAMAELMVNDAPGLLAAPFDLQRFSQGRFVDERVAAGVAH